MTGRQRILGALRGEQVDRVPFAINHWQWFYAQQIREAFPESVRHCRTPIEFLKEIGADIITRWDGQIKGRGAWGMHVKFPNCNYQITYSGEPPKLPITTAFNLYDKGSRVHRKLETPYGKLSQTWRFTAEACADFEEEYWIKDFDKDYEAMKFMIQDRSYDYDLSEYERDLTAVGEHGVIMLRIPENPIKMLHWLAGPEKATYFIMDNPDKFRELAEIHTQMTVHFVNEVIKRTCYEDAPLLLSADNLDQLMMPPYFFDLYLYDHYKRVAEVIHEAGRLFCVHSCGNNWDIRHCIRESGIDMMEGLTPPPLGNFPLDRAQEEIGPNFIVEGGMAASHQEIREGAKNAIDQYTRELFDSMGNKRRFIYSSSCNTSPNTPYDNIMHFRDCCWKYGKLN